MATGGDLSRTLEGGHQPFYEFPCSLCEEQGKHVEAVKYCEECFVYMCDTCLTSIHNRIPLNTRHKLLDQDQFQVISQSPLKSFPTKRCTKHPGELINIFCGNHDVVCCSVCKALEHSNCTATQHLPDAAKGIKTSKEYHSIIEETKNFLADVVKVLADRTADVSRIAKEKQQVKQIINDFRKKVNKYFDDLEQKSLNELDIKESAIVSNCENDRKFLEETKGEAEYILQQLDSFKGDNESELFFQIKTGKNFVYESLDRVERISSSAQESLVFNIDENIEKSLSSFVSLGFFDDRPVTRPQPLSDTNTGPAQASTVVQDNYAITQCATQVPVSHSGPFIKYKTQLYGRFNVQEKSDKKVCEIRDICQLPDGNILITDFNNKKLKRLDQTYKIIDSVQLPCEPACVCAIGPRVAAVSLCVFKTVKLVSVGRRLSLTMSFSTGNYCIGMVYTDNRLYVCCGSRYDSSSCCIEVYDNTGQLQHCLPGGSKRLSAVPKFITVSDDNKHLLVTSFNTDDISMLDLSGNKVSSFSNKQLIQPAGICTDGRGQVFVCGLGSNTLVQLSPRHQKSEVILARREGLNWPQGVYYDRNTSRLLVSCYDSNELLVYTCTQK